MLKEFKEFISRGSVIDLAIGLIMATYFGAIIKSMVDDLLMPLLGKLIGGIDFNNKKYIISEAITDADGVETTAEVALRYGAFLNTVITFIFVAFAVFLLVKIYNRIKRKQDKKEAVAPVPSKEEELLTEIRDLLKK